MLSWNTIFLIALYAYIFITIFYLLLENRETATTLSWLLVFIFLPFLGIILYLLFGRGTRKKARKKLILQNLEDRFQGVGDQLICGQKQEMEFLYAKYASPEKRKLIRLLYKNSDSILTRQNDVNIFYTGKDKFKVLLDDLNQAGSFISMEYFIWKSDHLSEEVILVLRKKAAQGVAVRILFDVMGNYLSKRYLKRLRRYGIKIYPYYNFHSPLKIHTLNYRNHRKIVIIDGVTGYIGGMNMGKEYVDGGNRFPSWRDTHIRIQGDAVSILQGIFSVSWYNTTREKIDIEPRIPVNRPESGMVPIQMTTSGPDSEWESIKQLYFLLISSAENNICIQTPYFIPDMSIVVALRTAALSGIDVRIMLTGHLDKRLPYWVARTFLEDLLNAGVRFYYYTEGFMHAKTIVVDGDRCSVGTANMDIRSFQLNYEINALIYDDAISQELENRFRIDLESSREFTLEDYNRMGKIKKFRNSLARLFAPLL